MISKERFYFSPTRETIVITLANHIQSNTEYALIEEGGGLGIVDTGTDVKTYFCPLDDAEFLEDIQRPVNSRFYEGLLFGNPYGIDNIQFSTPLGRDENETKKLLEVILRRISGRYLASEVRILWRKTPEHLPREKYIRARDGKLRAAV